MITSSVINGTRCCCVHAKTGMVNDSKATKGFGTLVRFLLGYIATQVEIINDSKEESNLDH